VEAEKEINGLKVRVDELTNNEFELQRLLQEEQAQRQECEDGRREWEEKHTDLRVKYEQLCVAHDEVNESYRLNFFSFISPLSFSSPSIAGNFHCVSIFLFLFLFLFLFVYLTKHHRYNAAQNHSKLLTEDLAVLKDHLSLESKVRVDAEMTVGKLNKQLSDLSKVEQSLDDALAEERARRYSSSLSFLYIFVLFVAL
jgi:hypothetical protein